MIWNNSRSATGDQRQAGLIMIPATHLTISAVLEAVRASNHRAALRRAVLSALLVVAIPAVRLDRKGSIRGSLAFGDRAFLMGTLSCLKLMRISKSGIGQLVSTICFSINSKAARTFAKD